MASGRVILLNGVSSAGKTTLANAIQSLAPKPMLRVSLDDFIAMLPDGAETQRTWFPVREVCVAGEPLPRIDIGPDGAKLLSAMRRFVAQLSAAGLPTVVDDVCEAAQIAGYRALLGSSDLLVIKVTAPLVELERRERARGNRLVGTSREQAARLHDGIAYDGEIDTGELSPNQAAETILSLT